MTKRQTQEIIGVVILVIIVISFGYGLVTSNPSTDQIANIAKPVESVSAQQFFNDANQFTARQENGTLPVAVPDRSPQDNPFTNLE